MKSLFRPKTLLISTCILLTGAFIFLFFDAYYGGQRFRTTKDIIYSFEDVDMTGLRELNASGGNLPRLAYVSFKLSHIKNPKMILDLKSEFHGYIHGIPSTFLGYDNEVPGTRHILRRLFITGSTKIQPELVTPESEEVKKYGFSYKTIDVGPKFNTPDSHIDQLVEFFDQLPKNVWLHVHCTNGTGRTTATLIMLDIMRNAPKVALKDIVRRHYLLGAMDMFDTTTWINGSYGKAELETRKRFIEKFYDFIVQRKAGGLQTWSEWNKKNFGGKDHFPIAR